MLYLAKVPEYLLVQIKTGAAYVDGVLIKSRGSGQILAHLQQTAKLTELLGGLGGVNPVTMTSQLVQNAQLHHIHQLLQSLQIISTVGAAASVLNLGVSLAGFAVVLKKLRQIEERLDSVEVKLDSLIKYQKKETRAKLYTGLQAAEEAIWMDQHGARLNNLQTANERLSDAYFSYQDDLLTDGLRSDFDVMRLKIQSKIILNQKVELGEVKSTISWMLFCAAARLEVLMTMGEYGAAIKFAEQVAGWLQAVHVTPREFLKSRVNYMAGPGVAAGMVQEAKALSDFLEQERHELSQTLEVLERMKHFNVDYVQYSREVRGGEVELLAMVYA